MIEFIKYQILRQSSPSVIRQLYTTDTIFRDLIRWYQSLQDIYVTDPDYKRFQSRLLFPKHTRVLRWYLNKYGLLLNRSYQVQIARFNRASIMDIVLDYENPDEAAIRWAGTRGATDVLKVYINREHDVSPALLSATLANQVDTAAFLLSQTSVDPTVYNYACVSNAIRHGHCEMLKLFLKFIDVEDIPFGAHEVQLCRRNPQLQRVLNGED